MTALVAHGVRKSYGDVHALAGVDLTVARGEVCALLGPNGAGKTTFASVVAGILRPDAGTVAVGGVDVVTDPRAARRLLGYAPQQLGIYPVATVRENLRLFGELAGLRRRALDQRIEEVGEALGLIPLLDRLAGMLSGGEQRRLHSAMALLHRPLLILLDEPTVAADVQTRATLLAYVRRLADEGAAVCYSTHYLQEVEELDATVALIDDGRILSRGRTGDLVAQYGHTFLELRFEGAAPTHARAVSTPELGDDMLRIPTREPAHDTVQVMQDLAGDTHRLVGIDIVRSNLEAVFIQLTGKRLADEATEDAHVA